MLRAGHSALGSGSMVSGFGFQVSGFGFRVSGFRFRISGFGFRVSGFGFRVSGFGSRDSGRATRIWSGDQKADLRGPLLVLLHLLAANLRRFKDRAVSGVSWCGFEMSRVVFRVSRESVGSSVFGFRVSGFGLRVLGLGFWVSGFGFRVSGFVVWVQGQEALRGFWVYGSGKKLGLSYHRGPGLGFLHGVLRHFRLHPCLDPNLVLGCWIQLIAQLIQLGAQSQLAGSKHGSLSITVGWLWNWTAKE